MKLHTKYQVMQEYYRESDGELMTDGYPIVYDTEEEAQECLKRLMSGSPKEIGGWVEPEAVLYVTDIQCA
jgi:hypothetical protein